MSTQKLCIYSYVRLIDYSYHSLSVDEKNQNKNHEVNVAILKISMWYKLPVFRSLINSQTETTIRIKLNVLTFEALLVF